MSSTFEYKLSIVIVNFRTPQFVVECLASLLPELNELPAKVVVVDNCSGDDSYDIIEKWRIENDSHQKIILLQSKNNSGFAGGNNTGIKEIKAQYYLLLNSDAYIRPGAIRILLETAEKNPAAGLFSPRLEWPNGQGQESCFRFHTPMSEFMRAAQTGLIDKILRKYVVALPVQNKLEQPEWTSFACVMIRQEVFNKIGLLDDHYFMYFEDVEFCYRAKKFGFPIIHNPDSKVVHLRGGSSIVKERTRLKKQLPRYFYESRSRFFFQLYGWPGLTAANLMWWLGRIISLTRQVLGRPDKAAIAMQWIDIWINWMAPLKPYTKPKS